MRRLDLGQWLLARVFGGGIGAEIGARGLSFLGRELRSALNRDEQRVTRVRLQPGETYTVIARPRATRRERRLAARQGALVADFERQTRPSRTQLRTARKLARVQRRLRRTRPGSRRFDRRSTREEQLGLRFDSMMRPSRKQIRTAESIDKVSGELDRLRAERLDAARRTNRHRRSVTVYS